jgi:hypothetical protein
MVFFKYKFVFVIFIFISKKIDLPVLLGQKALWLAIP